jgi:hypothetical protein
VRYGPGVAGRVRALGAVDAVFDAVGTGVLADAVALAGGPERVITVSDPAAADFGVTLSQLAPGRAPGALDARVGFVVPLRADTGWAARFDADAGPLGGLSALQQLDYVSYRERRLLTGQRTTWKGLLHPFPVTSQDTGARHDLRAAYIWSSEEAASVAAARERALAKAEAALTRIRNGLSGRYYKTRKQVGTRVAQILTGPVKDLITVRTGTRAGKPWITWAQPGRHRRRQPPRRVVRPGHQPARPRRGHPADRPRRAEDLQGPVGRRAAAPRP